MKKQIIVTIPDNPDYRVVADFGTFNNVIEDVWFFVLQKREYRKKWGFFGKPQPRWIEVDSRWTSDDFTTSSKVYKYAFELYDLLVGKRLNRARNAQEIERSL